MTNNSEKERKQSWTPDKYVQILQDVLSNYEKEHPHWQIEVLVSIIQGSLRSLKHYIEDPQEAHISWESPFVELRYPIEWNWDKPRVAAGANNVRSGISFGKLTKENTSDEKATVKTLSEIMVRRLNTAALEYFTNGAFFEIQNHYSTPILPVPLSEELNAIKGKRARREVFEQLVRPFSIGAASIDYHGMELQDGDQVPKRIAKQLANIDNLIDIKRIGIAGVVNGRKIEMSLIFQIHPLVANYDEKKAYHPITIGVFVEPRVEGNDIVANLPSDWPKADREILWRELLQEIDKIVDLLIPKAESESSEIFLINAQLEIPLASSHPADRNSAIKKVIDQLAQVGKVHEITVKSPESDRHAIIPPTPKELVPMAKKIPVTVQEALLLGIWKLRIRWLIFGIVIIAMAAFAVYAAQPEQVKIRILKNLGLYSSH